MEPYGEGRWRVWWNAGRKLDGTRAQRTRIIKGTKKDAQRFLARKQAEAGLVDGIAGITVDQFWNLYYEPMIDDMVAAESMAKSTAYRYKTDYRHVQAIFGHERMEDLTMRRIEHGLAAIPNQHTRHHALKVMRQMFNCAFGDGIIKDNPFLRRCRISKPKFKRQKVIKPAEFGAWLEAMRGFEFEAAVLLLAMGGLRREEVVPLLWDEDVRYRQVTIDGIAWPCQLVSITKATTDFEERDTTKTEDSQRVAVIVGPVAARLEELREPGLPVYHGAGGAKIKPDRLTRRLKAWCEKKGIDYVTPRNLRNSYATYRQAAGLDPSVTSRSMGHANLNIDYRHYFVVQEETYLRQAAEMAKNLAKT